MNKHFAYEICFAFITRLTVGYGRCETGVLKEVDGQVGLSLTYMNIARVQFVAKSVRMNGSDKFINKSILLLLSFGAQLTRVSGI